MLIGCWFSVILEWALIGDIQQSVISHLQLNKLLRGVRLSYPDISFLKDPLSHITRVERRNLLLASSAGFLVTQAKLVPKEISALGITLSEPDQKYFLLFVSGMIIYFLVAFVAFGLSDLYIWRKAYQDYLEELEAAKDSVSEESNIAFVMSGLPSLAWLYNSAGYLSVFRAVLEYLFPLFFGCYMAALGILGWLCS